MKAIEIVSTTLRGILNTPQGEYYANRFGQFPGNNIPPTPAGKSYLLRMVTTATETLERHRQDFRNYCSRIFAVGTPPPPEIGHIVSLLGRVRRVCHNAGNEWSEGIDENDRRRIVGEWSAVNGYIDGWILMVTEYFPQLASRPDVEVDTPGKLTTNQALTVSGGMTDRDMAIEQFRTGLMEKTAYDNAIKNGHISKPLTWNESISDLADWLDREDVIPKQPTRDGPRRCLWSRADGVFLKPDGTPITSRQLAQAFQDLKRQR